MRIALSNASRAWGGVHRVTEILVRGLLARGHEVKVLVRPQSILEQRLDGLVELAPVLRGMDASPLALARVTRTLRRWRPDVLVALMKKDVRLSLPAAHLLGVPSIVRHANDRPLDGGAWDRFFFGTLPAHHITNADATRRTLLASAPWLDARRISVIYNGIDVAPIDAAMPTALGLPDDAIAIGYVGSFEPRKGLRDLARAWPRIAEAVPAAHLVLVGTGSEEPALRALLTEAPRVHWLGYRTDTAAIYKTLDLLVLPSYVEGAPNVVLEAMAASVPVVATAVSGTPELVAAGITGELVTAGDVEQLASVVTALALDEARRRRYGAAGRERVERSFRLEAMLDRYETLLHDVAHGSSERGN